MGVNIVGSETERRFSELYAQCYPAILAYGRRRTDEATARDLAAETFAVAWRRFEDVDQLDLPWLYGVARHQLSNLERSQNRRERLQHRLTSTYGQEAVAGDHADVIAGVDAINALLKQLQPRERELLLLIAWEGLDVKTAAQVLGMSPNAARVRLHRTRKRLAAHLQQPQRGDGTPHQPLAKPPRV